MNNTIAIIAKYSFITVVFALCTARTAFAAARDITSASVLTAVNQTRLQNGLPVLSMNPKLVAAAENKGKNMQTYGYWAHTNPKTNETGWKFIEQAGYQYTNAGENLARDYTSIQGVLHGWMQSPTHKNVLLSDKYTETGIGVLYYTQNGVEKALVVELFASPIVKKQTLSDTVILAFSTVLRTMTL